MSKTLIHTAVMVLITICVKCTNYTYCRGNEIQLCGRLCDLINTYSKISCVAFVHKKRITTDGMYVKFTWRQNVQKQCNTYCLNFGTPALAYMLSIVIKRQSSQGGAKTRK